MSIDTKELLSNIIVDDLIYIFDYIGCVQPDTANYNYQALNGYQFKIRLGFKDNKRFIDARVIRLNEPTDKVIEENEILSISIADNESHDPVIVINDKSDFELYFSLISGGLVDFKRIVAWRYVGYKNRDVESIWSIVSENVTKMGVLSESVLTEVINGDTYPKFEIIHKDEYRIEVWSEDSHILTDIEFNPNNTLSVYKKRRLSKWNSDVKDPELLIERLIREVKSIESQM